jgi:carbamoyltransferase
MRKILGISCYYHDSAAALLLDGVIVAAAQQERFSRIKHDAGFPSDAIQYCLTEAGLRLEDLDAIVYYDKPLLKFERLLETYLAYAPRGLWSFIKAMPVWLKEKLLLKSVLRGEFSLLSGLAKPQLPQLLFSQHHQAHAASAFYPSPFNKAAVICLDGVGEWVASSIWLGDGHQLTPLTEQHFPHSLGLLYSAFTSYCGFKVNSGEYKLMGLAPYGEPNYVAQIYQLLRVHADGSFVLDLSYFDFEVGSRMTSAKFHQLFGGSPRAAKAPLQQKHMDLARSIQQVIEELVLKIAEHAHKITQCEAVCLAGGVALNCVANGRLLREGPFKKIWIQPAAGDAGGALGAALLAWHQSQDEQVASPALTAAGKITEQITEKSTEINADQMQGSLLGPAFSDAQILQRILHFNLPHQHLSEQTLYDKVADLLASGNVVGWFQGRMEFGPRALGNRSILGDPRSPQMQRQLNLKIKQRESFRPFAPAVLAEACSDYFELASDSPYMLLVAKVKAAWHLVADNQLADTAPEDKVPEDSKQPSSKPGNQQKLFGLDRLNAQRSLLPAITHVDYSARVQTVDAKTNPRFYQLIQAFAVKTSVPMLINTSFNVRGEPPVCSPDDAIAGFLATDMDYLVMGNYLLNKTEQDAALIAHFKAREFADD